LNIIENARDKTKIVKWSSIIPTLSKSYHFSKLILMIDMELQMHLKIISNSLLALNTVDEVRTIELLLESISKKLAADGFSCRA
jgi:hypothetical protein